MPLSFYDRNNYLSLDGGGAIDAAKENADLHGIRSNQNVTAHLRSQFKIYRDQAEKQKAYRLRRKQKDAID